jgi:alkanesulfonate monooxygenase SsuD/methylene tetrahydromethanopterin reductase-like flavin-dependent oxidoreductase (luciferase family)
MVTSNEPLSFGLSLPNRAALFGIPLESLLESAERAEASGQFDSIWVGDNFLSKPRVEAIVLLSALAARTTRVKLGTICLASFPLRHPIPLALQWASLDLLSGGRTILVVCNGAAASAGPRFAAELKAMGVRSIDRVGRVEEGIEILRRFFGPEPVTYRGRFYQFEDVDILPKPAQRRVPIVIAVNPPWYGDPAVEERALRRVARLADGWQSDGVPVDLFRQRWSRVQEYVAEYGRAGEVNHASLHLMVNINDDAGKAREESVAFLAEYYGAGAIGPAKLESWLAFGSPSQVVETIHRYIEAGCTTPVLRFTSWDQHGQLERCIRDVMPALHEIRRQHR